MTKTYRGTDIGTFSNIGALFYFFSFGRVPPLGLRVGLSASSCLPFSAAAVLFFAPDVRSKLQQLRLSTQTNSNAYGFSGVLIRLFFPSLLAGFPLLSLTRTTLMPSLRSGSFFPPFAMRQIKRLKNFFITYTSDRSTTLKISKDFKLKDQIMSVPILPPFAMLPIKNLKDFFITYISDKSTTLGISKDFKLKE